MDATTSFFARKYSRTTATAAALGDWAGGVVGDGVGVVLTGGRTAGEALEPLQPTAATAMRAADNASPSRRPPTNTGKD